MLAEWSTAAGGYHDKLLGMLAVCIFLLAAEEYYRASMKEQTENSVSCNNMGTLHTFAKECKRVPASSSNAGIIRALREVNRLALNKYSLEYVKGQQDRAARSKDLSLEARLNVEYDEMAKDAVRGSMARQLRHRTQELPLEKACIFIAGRKQTSDPKKDLKKQIGAVQEKAYYTSRERKKG